MGHLFPTNAYVGFPFLPLNRIVNTSFFMSTNLCLVWVNQMLLLVLMVTLANTILFKSCHSRQKKKKKKKAAEELSWEKEEAHSTPEKEILRDRVRVPQNHVSDKVYG